MSLLFASRAERGVNLDLHNKPFEIACEDIVFKFENTLNMRIILAREDGIACILPLPQITESSRRPFLRFLTWILNNRTFHFT